MTFPGEIVPGLSHLLLLTYPHSQTYACPFLTQQWAPLGELPQPTHTLLLHPLWQSGIYPTPLEIMLKSHYNKAWGHLHPQQSSKTSHSVWPLSLGHDSEGTFEECLRVLIGSTPYTRALPLD